MEDALQFYHFTEIDKKQISSTNLVEIYQLNGENRLVDPPTQSGNWRVPHGRFLCLAGYVLPGGILLRLEQ